jgi:hypothetical protein
MTAAALADPAAREFLRNADPVLARLIYGAPGLPSRRMEGRSSAVERLGTSFATDTDIGARRVDPDLAAAREHSPRQPFPQVRGIAPARVDRGTVLRCQSVW